MFVRDFMTTEVTSLQESETLLDATMVFVRSSFRHLPVLRGKQLVGIITERDVKRFAPSLLTSVTPEEYNQVMEATPLSRVMTRDPLTVHPSQPISEAATLFHEKKIGGLPVVQNGELVGLLTTTDMMGLLVRLIRERESATQGAST